MLVDRNRKFSLPGIHELNKDQDEALAMPMEGQHFIVGGPGTGKSVVALLRARKLKEANRTYGTLVFNKLLHHSNRHLFGSEQQFAAETWDSWFRRYFKKRLKTHIPTLEPEYPGGYCPIDWAAVEQLAQSLDYIENQSDKFLVIDEGQDMPPAFYRVLAHLGFENFYVTADQNQQIHPDKCSSRQDIENTLAIEPGDTLELKTNYRNTHPIALLAQYFFPADPASPKPALPELIPAATPELWTYGTASTATLSVIADNILQMSDRNPRKLIGIITPNNEVRKKFNNALRQASPRLDNDKPPIQTFVSGQREMPNFGQGGIMIINAQSCKGLEFDTAVLADIDQHQPKRDPYTLKARFYVMVARARDQVMLLRTGNICPVIEELLPTDPTILVRK